MQELSKKQLIAILAAAGITENPRTCKMTKNMNKGELIYMVAALRKARAPDAPGQAPGAGNDNTRPEPAPVPVAVVAPDVAAWLDPGKQLQAAGLMRVDTAPDFKLENYEQKELF